MFLKEFKPILNLLKQINQNWEPQNFTIITHIIQ